MMLLQASLLGFAAWTLAVMTFTVGVYRWSLILAGKAAIHELGPDGAGRAAWYRRGLRAHANCVENLPVFGAIVCVATWTGTSGPVLDAMGLTVLAARVAQTLTHVAFTETSRTVTVRFSFFFVQVAAMAVMAAMTFRAGIE